MVLALPQPKASLQTSALSPSVPQQLQCPRAVPLVPSLGGLEPPSQRAAPLQHLTPVSSAPLRHHAGQKAPLFSPRPRHRGHLFLGLLTHCPFPKSVPLQHLGPCRLGPRWLPQRQKAVPAHRYHGASSSAPLGSGKADVYQDSFGNLWVLQWESHLTANELMRFPFNVGVEHYGSNAQVDSRCDFHNGFRFWLVSG